MLFCGRKMDVSGWWFVNRVNDRPNKYTWNFLTPQIISKASLSISLALSRFLRLSWKQMQWLAQTHHSSREIEWHQFPQEMHHKEALVASWAHNVWILALRWSFLSHHGMLFRIAASISIDGCSLTTSSKGALLLIGWPRTCCSNLLAPAQERPHFSYITWAMCFRNCFHFLWWLVETMTVNTNSKRCLLYTSPSPRDA